MISLASLPILADGPPNHEAMRAFALEAVHQVIRRYTEADYALVSDETNNTPTRRLYGQLWVDISLSQKNDIGFDYIPICIQTIGSYTGFIRDLAERLDTLGRVLEKNA